MTIKTNWKNRAFLFLFHVLRDIWVIGVCLAALWCLAAFWFQLPFGRFGFIIVAILWIVFTVIGLAEEGHKPWRGRVLLITMFVGFGVWWHGIKPTFDRDWAPELARMVTAEFDAHHPGYVLLKNIRDFDWVTPYKGKPAWKDATYNIDDIIGLDIYLSYWMGPYIAHTLVGFTFKDGRHLVFSAEIRRTEKQDLSAIGGFFKEFELVMIAAPEEDIIKLRTDIRHEDVYRYQINIAPEKMRALFLTYLEKMNELSRKPRFYNTLTTNCTTVVYSLARVVDPGIPLDWRILFSGQLPSYLYDLKIINTGKSLPVIIDEARIVPQNDKPRSQYSVEIRRAQNFNSMQNSNGN